MLRNMRLGIRLGMAFGVVLFLLLTVGVFAINEMNVLSKLNRDLYLHPFTVSNAVLRIEGNVLKTHRIMHHVLLKPNESSLEDKLKTANELEKKILRDFKIVEKRFLGEKRQYERALELFRAWRKMHHEAGKLVRSNDIGFAAVITSAQYANLEEKILLALSDLNSFAQKKAAEFLADAEQTRNRAYVLMYLIIGAALVIGVVFTILITRSISRPARDIAKVSEAMARGDFSHQIHYQASDEIGQMATSLRNMLAGLIGEGQSIKKGLPVPMWTVDRELKITYLNEVARRIVKNIKGLENRDVLRRLGLSELFGDKRGEIGRIARVSLETGQRQEAEVCLHNGGKQMWLQVATSALKDLDGNITGVMGVGIDTTEHKSSQEKLREEKEQFQHYLDLAAVMVVALDSQGRIRLINRKGLEILGYGEKELLGENWFEKCLPRDMAAPVSEVFQQLLAGKADSAKYHENAVLTKKGDERLVAWHNAFLRNAEGSAIGILSSGEDITERKRAEEALKHSEKRFRATFEQMAVGICHTDFQGGFLRVNQCLCDFWGYSSDELLGMNCKQVTHPDDLEQCLKQNESVLSGETDSYSLEKRYIKKDGTQMWGQVTVSLVKGDAGRPEYFISVVRDISTRKKMEAQLRQAQKMEAIGTLAGGIAHDFNNVLGAIMGYTELTLEDLPEGGFEAENLERVLEAGHRAKNLVQQILSFSRQTEQELVPVRMAGIAEETMKLLRPSIPTTIEMTCDLGGAHENILADPIQIHQVIMNLCTNAAQAMEEKGGVLDIKLSPVDIDEEASRGYAELRAGRYLRLMVSDTGPGMNNETLQRIFEPFFTTKEANKGTGMGLAVVHGIVKHHGGEITVYSEVGRGSTFNVYLPVHEGEEASNQEAHPAPPITGTERVLLVDDEEALVALGKEMLRRLGYHVTAFTSSVEALDYFRSHPDDFDVVVSDYTMPKITGVVLGLELLRLRPKLPIIIVTGFTQQLTPERAFLLGIKRVVMKPLTGSGVARVIREVLDEQDGS